MSRTASFAKAAWAVLLFNLAVIAWGAFVRQSGSGDGCGSHWPDCNGVVVPWGAQTKTLIEFSHRASSGLALLAVVGLFVWAMRLFEKGSPVRKSSFGAVFFTMVSAVIGWALVKYGLVAKDDSMARAIVLSIHLVNTFFILACLTLTAHWGSGASRWNWRGQGASAWLLGCCLVLVVFAGVSGAVTSLGDTLFPAKNSAQVIWDSLTPTAHFLLRLRLWHPFIAMGTGMFLLFTCAAVGDMRPDKRLTPSLRWVGGLVTAQLALGLLAVVLKAPTPIAIAHLLLADLVWIALVVSTAKALGADTIRKHAVAEMKQSEAAI